VLAYQFEFQKCYNFAAKKITGFSTGYYSRPTTCIQRK